MKSMSSDPRIEEIRDHLAAGNTVCDYGIDSITNDKVQFAVMPASLKGDYKIPDEGATQEVRNYFNRGNKIGGIQKILPNSQMGQLMINGAKYMPDSETLEQVLDEVNRFYKDRMQALIFLAPEGFNIQEGEISRMTNMAEAMNTINNIKQKAWDSTEGLVDFQSLIVEETIQELDEADQLAVLLLRQEGRCPFGYGNE